MCKICDSQMMGRRHLIKSGKVKVVAARYDLKDGTVEYLT